MPRLALLKTERSSLPPERILFRTMFGGGLGSRIHMNKL